MRAVATYVNYVNDTNIVHNNNFTVCLYVPVDGQPNLTRWILDFDDNKITVSFDALSSSNNGMPIDCTAILVGPIAANISMAVRLLPSVVGLQVNDTIATCDLGMKFRHVLDNTLSLRNASNLFLYYNSSEVSATGMLLQDSNGMEYENALGTPAAEIVPDSNPPAVRSFELLDLNNGKLILSFSQPINVTTLIYPNVFVLSSLFTETVTTALSLSDGNCSDGCETGRCVTLSLKSTDLDRLKLESSVCTSVSNCYFYYNDAFVKDFGGNAIADYDHYTDFPLQGITFDDTSPSLNECILDLLLGQLSLVFNEPIDAGSFNPYGINVSIAAENVILSSASVIRSHNGSVIVIHLGLDADRIKISLHLGNDGIFVSLMASAFKDIAGTNIHPDSMMCTFINDTNQPNVSFFILDLNSNLLQIVFDEPIDMENVNMSGIKLTDAIGVASVNLGDSILIDFDDIDLFHAYGCDGLHDSNKLRTIYIALKNDSLTAVKNCSKFKFLLIANDSLFDLSSNGYISTGPIVAADIIEDNSPATIINFLLDMNTGQIIFTFNDVVDLSTFQQSRVLIQASSYRSSYSVAHRPYGSHNNSINSSIIVIRLSNFNLLKYQSLSGLAADINSTYVIIDTDAIDDIRGVDIIGITNGNGMIASNYIRDNEPPILTSFSLDLDYSRLWLTFNEPVQRTINYTLFSIQADSVNIMNTSINFSSSGARLSCSRYNGYCNYYTIFNIFLSNNSFTTLLYTDPIIAKSANTTNLVVMQGGVVDASGNPINTTGPVSANRLTTRRCKFHN